MIRATSGGKDEVITISRVVFSEQHGGLRIEPGEKPDRIAERWRYSAPLDVAVATAQVAPCREKIVAVQISYAEVA